LDHKKREEQRFSEAMRDLTEEVTEEVRNEEAEGTTSTEEVVQTLKNDQIARLKADGNGSLKSELSTVSKNIKSSETDGKPPGKDHSKPGGDASLSPKLKGPGCNSSPSSKDAKTQESSSGPSKPGPSGGCHRVCPADRERDRAERGSRLGARIFSKEKFVPREELVSQIMDMGICRNGAVKALYWTGNQSALAASNWIFDQPDRDLETPLEDELEMIRAQQMEREREEREERQSCGLCSIRQQHIHHIHHSHDTDEFDEEDMEEEELLDEDDEGEEEDEDDEDIDEEDEDEMDFKMVFVVNKSLDMKAGMMSLFVGKTATGLFRKINAQPQSAAVGPDELSMWGDLGEKMIILQADTCQHMKDLELMARNLRLPCHMSDQLEGQARKAVLGIFGEEKEVNKVTGRLKVVNN